MTTPKPFDRIYKLKNADQIFDLTCAVNYFAGQFDNNIPVEESRKAFDRIKQLLRKEKL